jgi:nucleotide-binding universal stress UspA family protein
MTRPSVLCPLDFSEASRTALQYAAAIAGYFGTRLTLLAVNDPLLGEAAELAAGPNRLVEDTVREMEKFFRDTFERNPDGLTDVSLDVAVGKPAPEILNIARERQCDLIVMGSHGATGFRKLFFGSTTERVLRETAVPVLITPGGTPPRTLEDARRTVRRILAPVDLTSASPGQLAIVGAIAETLDVPAVVLHVIEPVRSMVSTQVRVPKIEAERRYRAERELEEAIDGLPKTHAEALVAYGEPAEEIAKVAHDRDTGLIVMGLHSSPLLGPRMGSVTYRVLCLAHRLVLALPPHPAPGRQMDLRRADEALSEAVTPEQTFRPETPVEL